MSDRDYGRLSARQLAHLVNAREVTATQLLEFFLDRAEALNEEVFAFKSFTPELARQQAKAVDARVEAGEHLALAGVPVGIKDNMCVRDTPTTCSSRILENFVAPYESTATARLWQAGAVCLGKTNMDEFAMGSSTEHSAWGATRNPHRPDRVPGGSSGGSAAAVSAGIVPIALGSDTGGSIRQPASLCGVVGMKPTYGVVSRYGLVAFASSLDQIGPFARDVEDINLVLSVIAGEDPRDSTCRTGRYDYAPLAADASKLREISVGSIAGLSGMSEEVEACFRDTTTKLSDLGSQMSEVSMPALVKYSLDAYYIIAPAEASSNLARYDGVRYGRRAPDANNLDSMYRLSRGQGFGAEVSRRIMIGTYVLSAGYYDAYYKRALQVRRALKEEFDAAFAQVDFILTPTSPFTAFPLGDKTDDPLAMYLCDITTIPVNLAGLPAISLNCGQDREELPIGMQLIGKAGSDRELLEVAAALSSQMGVVAESV